VRRWRGRGGGVLESGVGGVAMMGRCPVASVLEPDRGLWEFYLLLPGSAVPWETVPFPRVSAAPLPPSSSSSSFSSSFSQQYHSRTGRTSSNTPVRRPLSGVIYSAHFTCCISMFLCIRKRMFYRKSSTTCDFRDYNCLYMHLCILVCIHMDEFMSM